MAPLDYDLYFWRNDFSPKTYFGVSLCPPFASSTKIPKISLPKSIIISTNHTLDDQCFNLDDLLARFGPPFSISVRDQLNLLNCNKYNAKTSLLPFRAFLFGIKNQLKVFFHPPFLGRHFLLSYVDIFLKIITLGTPSKSSGRQNGIQSRPSGAKMAPYPALPILYFEKC